jgi:hypothetical protein
MFQALCETFGSELNVPRRICHLLEVWIADYPTDFAVKGTSGALHALIRSILTKTHLLHYGSQLLPFLEVLPTLQDQDAVWAAQPEVTEESDGDSFWDDDDDDDIQLDDSEQQASSTRQPPLDIPGPLPAPPSATKTSILHSAASYRDRKPSLPLVRSLGLALNGYSDHTDPTSKQQLKELLRIANEIMALDASEVAEEITRVEAKYFLDITVRLFISRHSFVAQNLCRIVTGCTSFS